MGRNNKRGGKRGGGGRGGKPRDDTYRNDPIVNKAEMVNERFLNYYKAQNIIPENEWDDMLDKLRTPLPTTFRVAGSRVTAQSLNASIRDVHVKNLANVVFEDQPVEPPVQIPWYPDGLAWQFNVPKKVVRKSPEFKEFHSFLVFETEGGNISRQEAVSMLPPLFLDVEPHHKVIDMCAAPGSKTAQILEALHAHDTRTSTSIPSGMLIANDNDHKRVHLLIHQSARLPSPALMVTNLDASIYPHMKVPSPKNPKRLRPLLFDRILCDVPCSGDGTLRKNVGIWKTWQPMEANGLHSLQTRILTRAMKMLAPNGRIVYSTCSLNPVENEAVVAAALQSNPEFELVDVSHRFPELIRRPGMTSWKPIDKSLTVYETYEQFVEQTQEQHAFKAKLTRTHFPPDDVDSYNLPRCMRIYPHLQDTGGFFVAVIERRRTSESNTEPPKDLKREAPTDGEEPETKKPRLDETVIKEEEEEEAEIELDDTIEVEEELKAEDAPADAEVKVEAGPKPPSKQQQQPKKGDPGGSFKENPFTFLKADDPTVVTCLERLHINPNFPSSNFLVRNPEGEAARALYVANDLVKTVVQHNDYNRIRLTFAGTKVLVKHEGARGVDAQYRVLAEAVPLVLPYLDRAFVLEGDFESLRIFTEGLYPLCDAFPEPFKSTGIALAPGGHVIRFPQGRVEGVVLPDDLYLPIWKNNTSLTLMIDKKAKSALSMRVFGKDITAHKAPPVGKAAAAEEAKTATVLVAEDMEQQEEGRDADTLDDVEMLENGVEDQDA
uniref:tRNA (Cytosine-5-)-methyltransferase n=1 Tax=Mycena chlorophos TaxID=658473 RepID=A0ABQ0LED8_MYCCL|nr:tRNA (cytosine-5-)-methyltransferase [Mycena chlorophos]